uniref:SEC11 homolog A, signal peptidase complex subunit n=1 Tax=Strix occidentalis caurina TaxID=311401 RepID=A0A8D0EHK3_STROC
MLSLDFLDDVRRMNKRQVPNRGGAGCGGRIGAERIGPGLQNGDIKFLTKGDNNAVDDRGLYKRGQHWLEKKDVVGRARGFVPYIGIVTILMNDYPKFKYAVLFLLGLFVLVHRE